MRKGFVLILPVLLVLFLAVDGNVNPRDHGGMSGCFQGGHGKSHGGGVKHLIQMRQALELTDAQVDKLKSIRKDSAKKKINHEAEMKTLHLELEDLLSDKNVDRKKVDSIIDKLGKLHGEMKKLSIHARLDSKNVLTADQKKKMEELKKEKGHKKVIKKKMMFRIEEDGEDKGDGI
jgi:Spy/CpxP family protein refolding chaperone